MTIYPKLLYLARRNPSLDPDSFVPRWRQHGALGMSMPRWKNVWRYAHCDVIHDSGIENASDAYDGVGIVWHHSFEHRRAHQQDTSSQAMMEEDERVTFSGRLADSAASYDEHVIFEPVRGARYKLWRLHAISGDDLPALAEGAAMALARDVSAERLKPLVKGYVQNLRTPLEADAKFWGLEFHLVEEIWFDDLPRLVQAHRTLTSLAQLVPETISHGLTLVTNEVVLHNHY